MEDFIMYEEIFNKIQSAANKRNLKDSTIHAYCTSVAHFLNHTAKDIDALTTDAVSYTHLRAHETTSRIDFVQLELFELFKY